MLSKPRANLQSVGTTTSIPKKAIPLNDTMTHHIAKYDIECRVCGGFGFSATIRKEVSKIYQAVSIKP